MIVYYFGADGPWNAEDHSVIRRRNMALLSAIEQQDSVDKVYNIIRSTRKVVLNNRKLDGQKNTGISNIYIAPIFPERGKLGSLTRPINRWLLKKIYAEAFRSNASATQLAWCYWPKGFEDFEFLGQNMDMVFDTDHNIIDEPNYREVENAQRTDLLLRAGKRAKYILSSSRSMLAWYNQKGFMNTKILMNGVFSHRINLASLSQKNQNYTLTYCGTLSKWIKTDWLFKVIQEHPQWHFNFIGANYKTALDSELKKFSNVKLCGFLEPKKVDEVIKHSDVCFGLYQQKEALDVNSMKLYDYLAQGTPVVVNRYHLNLEKDFMNLLNIADTYSEFERFLAIPKTMDIKALDNFLNSSTWKQRVHNTLHELTT